MHAAAPHRIRRTLFLLAVAALLGAAPAPAAAPVDPGARMLTDDAAGEYWDVSATFAGGAYFFTRFWVTNEGPGLHTAVAMGYFVQPDGRRTDFKYGRTEGKWTLASGGRYLQIASAILDLREPDGRVEVDTEKYGVKVFLRFSMRPIGQPICARRGDGDGFDVVRLGEELNGLAWVEGMTTPLAAKGTIDITHGWSTRSEIDYLRRRIEVSGNNDELSFYAASVESPAGERNDCVAIRRGATVIQTNAAASADGTSAMTGTESGYPVPAALRFRDAALELDVQPQRQLLRVNPLDIVPQPFRTLLALRSSPRRVWTQARWRLKVAAADGRPAIDTSGSGLAALSYPNPVE